MEINIKESRKAKLTFDDLEAGDWFKFTSGTYKGLIGVKTDCGQRHLLVMESQGDFDEGYLFCEEDSILKYSVIRYHAKIVLTEK